MILKSLFVGTAMAAMGLVAGQANAADAIDPVTGYPIYVSVFGGGSILNDVVTDYYGSEYTVKMKTGYIFGGAIGVQLTDMFRTEIELSHGRNKAKSYRSSPADPFLPATGTISATYLLANVWLDWKNDFALTPYLGGGIGYGWAEGDTFFNGNTFGYGPGEGGLALQLGAGLKYNFSEQVSLDLGYRFKMLNGIDFDDSDGGGVYTGGDLRSHNVQVGLTFAF